MRLLGKVLAGSPQLQRQVPKVAAAVMGLASDFDGGRLRSLGDVFGVLGRVPGIDAGKLKLARSVLSGVFSEQNADLGDVIAAAVGEAGETQQRNETTNVQQPKLSKPTKTTTQRNATKTTRPALRTPNVWPAMEELRPLLSAQLLTNIAKLSARSARLCAIVDGQQNATAIVVWPSDTVPALRLAFEAYKIIATVGLAMGAEPVNECANATQRIADELAVLCTKASVDGRRAGRKVMIAVREFLRAVLLNIEHMHGKLSLMATKNGTVEEPARNQTATKSPPPRAQVAIILNGMATILASVVPVLRKTAQLVRLNLEAHLNVEAATRTALRNAAEMRKIVAALRRTVALLEAGVRSFADDAKRALLQRPEQQCPLADRALRHVLAALGKIGRIFAFKVEY